MISAQDSVESKMKQKRYHLDLGDIPFIENFTFSDQLNRLPAARNFDIPL